MVPLFKNNGIISNYFMPNNGIVPNYFMSLKLKDDKIYFFKKATTKKI